jgi:hypothetical protein
LASARLILLLLVVAELAVRGPGPIRVVGGLALMLVLPGLSLGESVLRSVAPGRAHRWLLIPGLSLASAALLGLVLFALGFRLTTNAWAVGLGVLVLVPLGLSLMVRDREVSAPERSETRPKLLGALALAGAALAAGAAVAVAANGERHAPTPGFTQLWALPSVGQPSGVVQVGVASHESAVMSYRVRVLVGRRVTAVRAVTLQPGAAWTFRIGGVHGPVTVVLSRGSAAAAYRRVDLVAG